MVSRVIGMVLSVGAVGALVGALLFGLRPEAQEAVTPDDDVSASELQLYIDVYEAMQADHAVTLDQVLAQKGVPLGELRNIERRIQREERLVRKVREALLAQAKARGEQLPAVAAKPAPPATTP
jgi:hypothetical protein